VYVNLPAKPLAAAITVRQPLVQGGYLIRKRVKVLALNLVTLHRIQRLLHQLSITHVFAPV
jgi:hypothetical protein